MLPSAALIDTNAAGREILYAAFRLPIGTIFLRYDIKVDLPIFKIVARGESITENVGSLIPEFLLGILVGGLDA